MIKRFIKSRLILNPDPSKSVASAAFVITMAGLVSRLLGLFRDRMLASTFGAGDTLDVYYAAFRIPDLIYNLLILGALSAAFIPVFTSLLTKEKKEEAWKMAGGVLNLAILAIAVFSIIFAVFAPWLMKLITPGFSGEKMQMVVYFTRIMFLSPLLLGISGVFGGVLTSLKRFLIYSIAPLLYNVGIIIGILVFVPLMGPIGLAWGVVFGALMHMLTQYPAVRHAGFKIDWNFLLAFKNSDIRKVLRLMLPRTLGIAVNQVNLVVITIFASLLSAGSLAIFNFAQGLQGVTLGLFGISFAIAVFPVLSSAAAREEKNGFISAFSDTFRQILFFVIPLSIFILVLRAQIVRVVLGSGKFDWEDTILTFQCLGIFSLSLFAQSLVPLLARAFYALHDTKTPFYVALVTEIINISAVVLLIDKYQVLGLAAAFSIASVFQMIALLFILRTRFPSLDDRNIIISVSKVAAASFLAGLAVQLTKYQITRIPMINLDTFLGVFIQLAAAGIMGLVFFIGGCYLLQIEEFFRFKASLTRKLFRSRKVITEDLTEAGGI
ncbi:MAG: murein biosynthesis integral membrane protein MurJ [Candidatus Moranbacteria bacterium]|nr:murein biosynthesis integral membrane protein MurJ [Candidatus Moranbacteria bacterium]